MTVNSELSIYAPIPLPKLVSNQEPPSEAIWCDNPNDDIPILQWKTVHDKGYLSRIPYDETEAQRWLLVNRYLQQEYPLCIAVYPVQSQYSDEFLILVHKPDGLHWIGSVYEDEAGSLTDRDIIIGVRSLFIQANTQNMIFAPYSLE